MMKPGRLNEYLQIGRVPRPAPSSQQIGTTNPGQDLVNLIRTGKSSIRVPKVR